MNCIFLRRRYGEIETGPDYKDNFADNDWATIAAVCAAGLVPTTWKVGDQKAMTINGTSYPIDIIGLSHDDYADGSGKAPITFQLHDCYGTTYQLHNSATNSVGWGGCDLRTTNLPAILALMPSEVRAGIKEVNKKTSAGNSSSTIKTTADKLFLLSEIEVFDTTSRSYSGEGSQYAYYKNGGSTIKKVNGTADYWWLRSPKSSASNAFCRVSTSGAISDNMPTGSRGIAFAFCLGNKVGGGSSGGGTAPTEYTIAVTGTGNSNYVYVTINGTKVTSAGSYTISPGDSISCNCQPNNFFSSGTITLNGTTVATAAYNSAAEYTFAPSGDCSIALTYSGSAACSIAITTT